MSDQMHCYRCKRDLPSEAFYAKSRGWCRQCQIRANTERRRALAQAGGEAYRKALQANRQRHERWKSANPDKMREAKRRWYQANRERHAQSDRSWRRAKILIAAVDEGRRQGLTTFRVVATEKPGGSGVALIAWPMAEGRPLPPNCVTVFECVSGPEGVRVLEWEGLHGTIRPAAEVAFRKMGVQA